MQIVIEISETLKEIADEEDIKTFSHFMWLTIVMDAIKSGIPLPKGHGRLIDADALIDTLGCSDRDIYVEACIEEDAPTIIGAYKAESEG